MAQEDADDSEDNAGADDADDYDDADDDEDDEQDDEEEKQGHDLGLYHDDETDDNDDDDIDDNDVDNFKIDDDTPMVPQHFVPESIGYVLIRVPCPLVQLCNCAKIIEQINPRPLGDNMGHARQDKNASFNHL